MKKKQKINKAVNSGEWLLLILTALFLCVLFFLNRRPGPESAVTVRTAAKRNPAPSPDSAAASALDGVSGQTAPESNAASGQMALESGAASASDSASGQTVPESDSASVSDEDNGRVNLNTADAAELSTLPGIGPSLAGRIIAYREEHGPFARPEDVMRVSGIGQGKYAAIAGLVSV